MRTLSGNKLGDVNVFENNAENNPYIKNSRLQTYSNTEGENSGSAEIIWDSHLGLEFTNEGGIISWLLGSNFKDEKGVLSPAEGFLHEMGHMKNFFSNAKRHKKDTETKLNCAYGDMEEYKVITKVENPASVKLGHLKRKSHHGNFVKVKSPISIEKQE